MTCHDEHGSILFSLFSSRRYGGIWSLYLCLQDSSFNTDYINNSRYHGHDFPGESKGDSNFRRTQIVAPGAKSHLRPRMIVRGQQPLGSWSELL